MSVEEQKFYEFNNALPDYVVMGMAELGIDDEDLDDLSVIVQFSNSLTFLIIDRLLGGSGKARELDRDFSEIEITVIHETMDKLVEILKDPWLNYASLTPKLNGIETNARIASSSMYNDAMIIAAMEVVINETKAMISICLPAVQLDAFMHKYAKAAIQQKRQLRPIKEKERKDNLLVAVEQSNLDVSAVLGEVTLDILDVLNLQVNDIIPLRKNISSNIVIKVGGKKWYDGKLGVFNNRKAIRVENIYEDLTEFQNHH
jgi:flagellar motor switch protein FliM